MEIKDGVKTFYARSRQEWRTWLQKNHLSESSAWLIIYNKNSGVPSVDYPEAVEEALCFGWIDSKANKRDTKSRYQFFAKRNPKSNWSRINKNRIERMIAQNLMAEAGLEMVRIAKETGTWTALDEVENLIVPQDLQAAFSQKAKAFKHWEQFPRSVKRGILEWILNAKKPETRQKRIDETILLAEQNIRANQFRKK